MYSTVLWAITGLKRDSRFYMPGLNKGVEMTIFGLKWGQDLGNRAAHPHQELQGVSPRVENTRTSLIRITRLADIHFVIGISVSLEWKFRSMFVHSAKNL